MKYNTRRFFVDRYLSECIIFFLLYATKTSAKRIQWNGRAFCGVRFYLQSSSFTWSHFYSFAHFRCSLCKVPRNKSILFFQRFVLPADNHKMDQRQIWLLAINISIVHRRRRRRCWWFLQWKLAMVEKVHHICFFAFDVSVACTISVED